MGEKCWRDMKLVGFGVCRMLESRKCEFQKIFQRIALKVFSPCAVSKWHSLGFLESWWQTIGVEVNHPLGRKGDSLEGLHSYRKAGVWTQVGYKPTRALSSHFSFQLLPVLASFTQTGFFRTGTTQVPGSSWSASCSCAM